MAVTRRRQRGQEARVVATQRSSSRPWNAWTAITRAGPCSAARSSSQRGARSTPVAVALTSSPGTALRSPAPRNVRCAYRSKCASSHAGMRCAVGHRNWDVSSRGTQYANCIARRADAVVLMSAIHLAAPITEFPRPMNLHESTTIRRLAAALRDVAAAHDERLHVGGSARRRPPRRPRDMWCGLYWCTNPTAACTAVRVFAL